MKIIVVDINGTPHETSDGTRLDFDVMAIWSGSRFLVLASNDGNLYDPLDTNNRTNKRDRERGGLFWNLKTCSEECYKQYTVFLRSKNRTPFILAERRFRNDVR